MTMPSWPATVPFLSNLSSLSSGGPQAVIRTEMDAGPAKVRPRFTAAPEQVTGRTGTMTSVQRDDLVAFFRDDLHMGALSFTATDPRTCQTATFRFLGPYEIARVARDRWQATLRLEALP